MYMYDNCVYTVGRSDGYRFCHERSRTSGFTPVEYVI